MTFNGYVAANRIPRIFNESSIILQLTNVSTGKGPKGIMTTKLFESLAVEKPVLCVKNDKGCIEETISESGAGISASTAEEAYDFILKQYQIWKEKGLTAANVHKEVMRKYSRKEQAQQFVDIFKSLLNTKQ